MPLLLVTKTKQNQGHPYLIRRSVDKVPKLGHPYLSTKGQDIAKGSLQYQGGERLAAADIGLLASLGLAEISVSKRSRVVLLSTGDELVEPGQPLAEGQIYNSNRAMLTFLRPKARR